jgi:mono/diheme cytochrome c family protein
MTRRSLRSVVLVSFIACAGALAVAASPLESLPQDKKAAADDSNKPGGWTIPPDAAQKKSPLTVDAKVLAQGKAVFKSKCQRCHGPGGLGDGPDADPDNQADMDLTVANRASKNPDGVVFYKVTNGRKRPKMPSFKGELTQQQIWAVIAYAQSLRAK